MLVEMAAGGGLLAAGVVLGRLLPDRRRARKSPKPICGCTHELAFHDSATSECHGTVSEPSRYDRFGEVTAYRTVRCTCRQYDGPTPLPTVYAPEVSG